MKNQSFNWSAATIHIALWISLFSAGLPGSTVNAEEMKNQANGLRWEDDTGKTLFTAEDIVRFDWERQVFELKRETAMDLMVYLVAHRHLHRAFVVRDAEGAIYGGQFVSLSSSQTYDGPTIMENGAELEPPSYAIQRGYHREGGKRDDARFNQRLHDDLEKAGLLKTISPTEKPLPIEKIHTEWLGDRDKIRMRAEIFAETFRIGQPARVHLFFTPGLTPPPAFDTVEIHSTLAQDNAFFCTTDHSIPDKLTPETIKTGIHVLRWKPWGPVYGAGESLAKTGSATLSLNLILRKQTTNGQEVVCTATIPAQKLTILPPVETVGTAAILRATDLGTSNLLQQARALCQQSFRNLTTSNRQENFASFRRLLHALAAVDAEVRGNTPEEKTLLRVAREAGARPALMDDLLEYYGHWRGTGAQPQVLLPPRPQAAHLTEAYRPAWEALLLAPPSYEIQFMQQRFVITDALSKIGNPESLPVLELAFAAPCEEGAVGGSAERQFRIMECLNRFATRESLQAMFRCLSRAEEASGGHLPGYSGYDLREWVVRFLTNQDNYETGGKWSQVLKSFPKDTLPANQRDLLERATRQR